MKKIIVSQIGARHRYLIPQILEAKGMLTALYTDSTRHSFLGRISKWLLRLRIASKSITRLKNREPLIELSKIHSSDILFFKGKLTSLLKFKTQNKEDLRFLAMNNKMISWGVQDADCIYNMYIENVDFLKYAKKKGLKIIVDIYENPMTFKLLLDEINNYPKLSVFQSRKEVYALKHITRMRYIEEILSLADYYTVPSKFVLQSLERFNNFDKKKHVIIPYATSLTSAEYKYKPIKGRIIWVGSNAICKGLIYYAQAAEILKTKYPFLDFRVIGESTSEIIHSAHFKHLNFLGVLSKEALANEYKCAEAYVFPTITEGLASSVIEAASFGCPIITTECAGIDIENFPAIYIPTRDVEAIVKSVEYIIDNPNQRDAISIKTYNYSKIFSRKNYEVRLTDFFNSID